jgi:hypothetical protein
MKKPPVIRHLARGQVKVSAQYDHRIGAIRA